MSDSPESEMENQHAHAVPIIIPAENNRNKFLFEEDTLEKILLQKDIADRIAIVVSSIAPGEVENDWLGDEDSPLEGFSWRGGDERNTTGIQMWSKIFKVDLPEGEKAAVILMDTQGTFDNKSTVRECATIFALSTMLSSIQIFNVMHNLQEDHLQHLELFAEYGKLFVHDNDHRPFQKLQFLVRDWSYPYQRSYGSEGGQSIIQDRLELNAEQAPQQQTLRNNIRSCFTDIHCFLMPHPGLKVATNPHFDGRLSDIDDEFKTNLRKFILNVLSVENLVQKEIGGRKIKVRELLCYFRYYKELFNGDNLPEPQSMLAATAEANILSVMTEAREYFIYFMLNAFENKESYFTPEELEEVFQTAKTETILKFDEKPKMGGDELLSSHRNKLNEDILNEYTRFKILNKGKAEISNQRSFAAGKESYSQKMASICENAKPYLSVDQFKRAHEENWRLAFLKFESNGRLGRDSLLNEYIAKLEHDIIAEHDRFYAFNKNKADANNRAAIIASKEQYHKKMAEILQNSNELFFSSEKLEQVHAKFRTEIIEYFDSRCLPNGDVFSDTDRINLIKDINEDFEHFKLFNKNNKKSYLLRTTAAVRENYHRGMTTACEAAFPYFTNEELKKEHLRCQTEAMHNIVDREIPESYQNKLKEYIDMDYNRFKNFNKSKADAHNQLAGSSGKEYYVRQMNILFEGPQRYFSPEEFEQEHQRCKIAALEHFDKQSRKSSNEFSEIYRIKLEEEIEIEREWFQTHNKTKANVARAFSIGKVARRNDIVRDIISGATAGAVIIGTAAAGPAGALFGAVWGAILGRGVSAALRETPNCRKLKMYGCGLTIETFRKLTRVWRDVKRPKVAKLDETS